MKLPKLAPTLKRLTEPQKRIQELEQEIEEHRRSTSLLWALDQAAAAMAEAMTAEDCYRTIAEQLDALGLRTSVLHYVAEDDILRLAYMADFTDAITRLEELTGLDRTLALSTDNDFHGPIIKSRTTEFSSNFAEIIERVLPDLIKPLAPTITATLGMGRSIGAPLVVEDAVIGVLVVSSSELTSSDTASISAFAHQVSATLGKVRLVQKLQKSLADLENAEAQLVASQKMQAVGRLAGGIAHDLNNLLTSISVSCEVLRADSKEGPASVELETIAHATSGAAALIRQLLAFGRKQVLDRKAQNLNDIVLGMGRLLDRVLGEDVKVKLMLEGDLRSTRIDRMQLEQVILNLSVNARDAMEQGGQLRIQTQNVDAGRLDFGDDEPLAGELVCLRFYDTGCGMDPEVAAQVFEPFFTTKAPGRGTGLGLSVVYGIVRQHGGLVRIESEPGHGTLFELFFPATDAPPVAAPRRAAPVNLQLLPLAGQRILLVEDDDGVRRAVQRVLRRKGYDVASVGCVFDALQLFEAEGDTFQLLLSDVVLPDGLGPTLAEQLTARRPDLGVVLATGYAGARAHSDVAKAQHWTLLHKPFELELLLDAVAAAIGDPPGDHPAEAS